jgi:hypothetical protein
LKRFLYIRRNVWFISIHYPSIGLRILRKTVNMSQRSCHIII